MESHLGIEAVLTTTLAVGKRLDFTKPVERKVIMVSMNAPGVKLISRASYENTAAVMGTPFDYPLSSRLDENDAIFVLEETFIPWKDNCAS